MDSELKLRAQKGQLEFHQTNLRAEARGLCRTINSILTPDVTSIEDMAIKKAAEHMDDLVLKKVKLLDLQGKILELEAAIG